MSRTCKLLLEFQIILNNFREFQIIMLSNQVRVLPDGGVWEKAGVNVSVVYEIMPLEAYLAAKGEEEANGKKAGLVPFFVAGISSELERGKSARMELEKTASHQVGHVRIRQHVNPLSSSFSTPPPDCKDVFEDCTLPLMVDVGCGSGRFLIWLAKNSSESQNLVLEIRQKLVQRSQATSITK